MEDDNRQLSKILFYALIIIYIMALMNIALKCQQTPQNSIGKFENNYVSITAVVSPIFIETQVYGSYMVIDNKEQVIEVNNETTLISKIINCESSWNSKAQSEYSTAYGLGQFLDSTWAYVQKKWNMKLDRYSYNDQLYATERLLKEEGTKHWEESKNCWSK